MTNKVTIEQEIGNIFQLLTLNADENTLVKRVNPARGRSCKGEIDVYRRSARHGADGEQDVKDVLVARYVFYPSTYYPTRLGSVAIYCENAAILCGQLQKDRVLFGHRIVGAQMEWGRRPFVDVRLAP